MFDFFCYSKFVFNIFSAHGSTVNKLRSEILRTIFKKDCIVNFSGLLAKLTKGAPTYTEITSCTSCEYYSSDEFEQLGLHESFEHNFKNLLLAIQSNLVEKSDKCVRCNGDAVFTRTFHKHLFIEVRSNYLYFCFFIESNFFLFLFQIPKDAQNFENGEIVDAYHKLQDIPPVLNYFDKTYLLSAAAVFQPPLERKTGKETGHYFAAIKINESWQAYDDNREKPFSISSDLDVVIATVCYVMSE